MSDADKLESKQDQGGGSPMMVDSNEDEEQSDFDSDFGFELDIPYDEEVERAIRAAESQSQLQSQPVVNETDQQLIQTIGSSENAVNGDKDDQLHSNDVSVNGKVNVDMGGDMHMDVDLKTDIEDLPLELAMDRLSPFAQFRRKGYLSVSDLVGPVWCETQYDYRLRTLPYLPPSQRPDIIKSKEGNEIVVDKVKVEDKERILRRGEVIHKRLERELHPEEITVHVSTPEENWGLRFLNMLAAIKSLLDQGKCRELPVAGFVKGVLVYGIIDEVVREAIPADPKTDIPAKDKSQTSLMSYAFSSSRTTSAASASAAISKPRTHRLRISDSKTRTSDALPKEEDTLAGRLQVMLYKELLDAILLSATSPSTTTLASRSNAEDPRSSSGSTSILPSRNTFSWDFIFAHLGLDPNAEFSEVFLAQSQLVVLGNNIGFNADQAKTLDDLRIVFEKYISLLGLGEPVLQSRVNSRNGQYKGKGKAKDKDEDKNLGKTEDLLKLVYRRASGKKKTKKNKQKKHKELRRSKRLKGGAEHAEKVEIEEQGEPPPSTRSHTSQQDLSEEDAKEARLIELAIQESLKSTNVPDIQYPDTSSKGNPDPIIESAGTVPLRPPTGSSEQKYWGSEDDEDNENDEEDVDLALAVEMSLNPDLKVREDLELEHDALENGHGIVHVNVQHIPDNPGNTQSTTGSSQNSAISTNPAEALSHKHVEAEDDDGKSGSGKVIGVHRFSHSPLLLARHLENVLQFWMGEREPSGVSLEETRRCGWCEFEESCEWR
ncbi:uncharacterized protein I303_101405 [Kwoniella dejecticola CBS 10117]|uniref:Exonuclease V n=1 Tax=Kwoniella dejecticola CBS 10117 TaxID=1296121 RepID=A0A1A6AHN2_9TREE|nr:uncharacterized protein I303_01414 [Kwoniella dejecticola CBS 10117]OBR89585.1 hypothetical protein I303_01414 [Kwoniella dejecticola CBS 10117]